MNICFAKVKEVKDVNKLLKVDPPKVDQWVGVFVSLKYLLKDRASCCQDDLVSLQLLTIFTDQSDISESFVLSEHSKRRADIFFEIIPLQTKLLGHFGAGFRTIFLGWV